MSETQIAEWTEFLNKAEAEGILTREQSPLTLIEAIGYERKENFYNALLKFFFQTESEHDMSDLMVSSLLEAFSEKDNRTDIPTDNIKVNNVEKEYTTKARNRIDLLIETDQHVIGIENKIDAWVNNDFEEYEQAINNLAANDSGSSPGRQPVCVLLSPYKQKKQKEHKSFIPITYEEFFKKIEKNLGNYATGAHPEYLQFLLHFIKTIRNLTMNNELNKEMKEFLQQEDNVEKAQNFTNALQVYEEELRKKLVSDENLKYFNDKSNIIHAHLWENVPGKKGPKQKKYITINFNRSNDPTFAIDILYGFPDDAIIDVFFRKEKNGAAGPRGRTKNLLHKFSLLEEFKVSENDRNKFQIKESIPLDDITKEENVLGRLIKAILKEYGEKK